MSTPAYLKWVQESKKTRRDGKLATYAYLSLRQEGHVHIGIDMLTMRMQLFAMIKSFMQTLDEDDHHRLLPIALFGAEPSGEHGRI